ncbi:MAG: HEAT repeat domain-containing protein [Planctomycetota bacterium]|jgi:hypothetical protein
MKSLPLKLAIIVVIIFGVTIAAMLLYKPLKLRWYEMELDSDNINTRRHAVEKLLTFGDGGKAALVPWLKKQLDSEDIETRRYAVEKLLALGDGGEAVIHVRFDGKDCYDIDNFLGESLDTKCYEASPPISLNESELREWYKHSDAIISNFEKFSVRFNYFLKFTRIVPHDSPAETTPFRWRR